MSTEKELKIKKNDGGFLLDFLLQRDEVLMFLRQMFDQAFIDGRINCIQAYPGEALKDVRDRFMQLREMRQRGPGRVVQVAALVKKE